MREAHTYTHKKATSRKNERKSPKENLAELFAQNEELYNWPVFFTIELFSPFFISGIIFKTYFPQKSAILVLFASNENI